MRPLSPPGRARRGVVEGRRARARAGSNWKKRYFVLRDNSLVYYETHKRMDDAKGDVMLTPRCEVRDVDDDPKRPHCFEILSAARNNERLMLEAASADERADWVSAVRDAISTSGSSVQGELPGPP